MARWSVDQTAAPSEPRERTGKKNHGTNRKRRNEVAAPYPADEWFLKEAGQSRPHGRPAFSLLPLRQDSQDAADQSGDGCWHLGSRLVLCGNCGPGYLRWPCIPFPKTENMARMGQDAHKRLPCGTHALIEAQRRSEMHSMIGQLRHWMIGLLWIAILLAIFCIVRKRTHSHISS